MSLIIVEVEWRDTMGYGPWTDKNRIEDVVDTKDSLIRSVGYLVKETETEIVIAQSSSYSLKGNWGELMTIPLSNIIKKREFKSTFKFENKGVEKDGR